MICMLLASQLLVCAGFGTHVTYNLSVLLLNVELWVSGLELWIEMSGPS